MTGSDFEKYRVHLDGFDLTDQQKDEVIESVWSICEYFVDRGFGDDSVQNIFRQVSDPCEQKMREIEHETALESDPDTQNNKNKDIEP